uniref:GST N-terminal domain-containing protein n=1 Tax=Guillardia theta TaxID=55529 RepID=A0A7S4KL82_GUITH|mmetsp:Transcript_26735/g.87630  ORF Transcript_26735/g.87630 Transcript_26735/m.87630 type:complete len:541 (+) Transcript_26735:62-1684(+)
MTFVRGGPLRKVTRPLLFRSNPLVRSLIIGAACIPATAAFISATKLPSLRDQLSRSNLQGSTFPPRVRKTSSSSANMNIFGAFSGQGATQQKFSQSFVEGAPSWAQLEEMVKGTATGARLIEEKQQRMRGEGPTHRENKLRLFGHDEKEIRVVLYRDSAAWCPYCQKVWLLLEEKKIPYKIELINMRSYGDKPDWFLAKNPRGLLPVVEVDGKMISESVYIMQVLDSLSESNPMLPRSDEKLMDRANSLMQLERRLFGDWCGFVFQPGSFGKSSFEATLNLVDEALTSSPGPWFLGGDNPSIVDLQYISHIERMIPSCLYWKGFQMRGNGKWKGIERWLAAFEERPTYMATKSDYYTHVMDIPPQYGPGQSIPEGEKYQKEIDGRSGWSLPLAPLSETSLEPVLPFNNLGEEAARHEAATVLLGNHQAVARFCCRAAGSGVGDWFRRGGMTRSKLADPNAQPNDEYLTDVDACLRILTRALLVGTQAVEKDTSFPSSGSRVQRECLLYLQQRISVPRDMSFPAARQLRAHLSWMMDKLGA